jgi:predicted nuclease of predicted toxin-antitoxin system
VKLLLDENLAAQLAVRVRGSFPDSAHVRDVGLKSASDLEVWEYARLHGFAIVSKDWDFQQLSFVHGAPPKVISIRRGNCSVQELEHLLLTQAQVIEAFGDDREASLLVLA